MKTENTDRAANNTGTIARNAFWNGVEAVSTLLTVFLTSVVVARVVGKDAVNQARLGYYNYISWLTNVTILLGSFGLSGTAGKYMAEYLNRGEAGVARATYLITLKLQTYLALGVIALALGALVWLGAPGFFLPSMLLILAIGPRLVATVPSNANNASEVLRRNTGPAVAGALTAVTITVAALLLAYRHDRARGGNPSGWDLIGLAIAVLAGSALECGWKLRTVEKWLGGIASVRITPELKKRMFAYSGRGLLLLLLNIVVWDRSDIVILQMLNPDRRQLLFFSVSFSLAERFLLIPGVFCASLAATILAQYGRDQDRLKEMTVDGARYALLLSLPLFLGMACISKPLVLLVYGKPYWPMITTLEIVALMAIPKALISPPTMMLQAAERQVFLIVWGCMCGAVDFGLDFLLVRKYGANGAAFANGTAQALAAAGIWIYVWRVNRLDLKLRDFGRILACGLIMAAAAFGITRLIPGAIGMFGAIAVSVPLWFVSLRVTKALKPQDTGRFLAISKRVPARLRPRCTQLIAWLAPDSAA